MKYVFLFLAFFLQVSAQADVQTVQMKKEPSKLGSIQVEHLFTIEDEEDGFYSNAMSARMPNGNIVVLDKGNKLVHVFDKEGKKLVVFGKEGNGPGEISSPMFVFASNDRIIVTEVLKAHIYDASGKHIEDVKLLVGGQQAMILHQGNQFYVHQLFQKNPKFLYGKLSPDGEISGLVKNPNYKSDAGNQNTQYFTSTISQIITDAGIYSHEEKDYAVVLNSKSMTPLKKFTRPFERVERKDDEYPTISFGGSKTDKKIMAKQKKANAELRRKTGKYHNDINHFLGYDKGHLFVSVRSKEKNEMKIDVLKDGVFIDQLTVKHQNQWAGARVSGGILLVDDKNDDIGPFISVYKLSY